MKGIKKENEDTPMGDVHEDTEMGDDSNQASDEEDGDEADEGDDDEEDGTPEVQDSPAKPLSSASPKPEAIRSLSTIPTLEPDVEMTDAESPQLATVEKLKLDPVQAGSPLKNVALSTSSVNAPLPSPGIPEVAPSEAPAEALEVDAAPASLEPVLPNLPLSIDMAEDLPPPPPNPTKEHEQASQSLVREELEEEKMLLDAFEGTNQVTSQSGIQESPVIAASMDAPSPARDVKPEVDNEEIRKDDNTQQGIDPAGADGSPKGTEPTKEEEKGEDQKSEPDHEDGSPVVEDKENKASKDAEPPSEAAPLNSEQDDVPDLLGDLEKTLGA